MGKRILVINTFPIVEAQTGGQKREVAIVEAYKKVFDVVQYVGVFFKDYYKHYAPTDIPLSPALTEAVHRSPHTVDMICGNAIFEDPAVRRRMTAILRQVKPDIIQIEQVFPYFGLKRLLEALDMHPKLILSSHNVEAPHKREILHSVHMPDAEIEPIVAQIDELERELARESEVVIACTENDAKVYRGYGAKNVVLARNGMARITSTDKAMQTWRDYFTAHGISKKALFVASAHPPSWTGFEAMVGLGVGFMPFDARIVMAGGIADHFRDSVKEEYNPAHLTFWHRVILAGRISDDSLGALLKQADVILLPITEGGGSNLKTAEAILADKPVVATTHAFRSFESLQTLPNVYLADTPEAFRQAIVTAMTAKPQKLTPAQRIAAEAVLWENCLKDAVQEVAKL